MFWRTRVQRTDKTHTPTHRHTSSPPSLLSLSLSAYACRRFYCANEHNTPPLPPPKTPQAQKHIGSDEKYMLLYFSHWNTKKNKPKRRTEVPTRLLSTVRNFGGPVHRVCVLSGNIGLNIITFKVQCFNSPLRGVHYTKNRSSHLNKLPGIKGHEQNWNNL